MKLSHVLSFSLVHAVMALASLGWAQPANDLFANRTVITGTNSVATGSNVGATWEAGEPYHAGNSGGASVWWLWTAPFSGFVTISTAGSSLDTLLGVYVGSSVSRLVHDYAFFDGSVRSLLYGQALCPLNLWAVTAAGQTNYGICRPH